MAGENWLLTGCEWREGAGRSPISHFLLDQAQAWMAGVLPALPPRTPLSPFHPIPFGASVGAEALRMHL